MDLKPHGWKGIQELWKWTCRIFNDDDDDDSGSSDDVLLPMNRMQRIRLLNGWSLETNESLCELWDASIVFGICGFF